MGESINKKQIASNNRSPWVAANGAQLAWVVGFIALFFLVARGNLLSDIGLLWWTDLAWTFAALATAAKCFSVASSLRNSEKTSWYLIGWACLVWFLGMLVWDYYELVTGRATPFPAWSDIGFLAFALIFMAAFFAFRAGVPSRSFSLMQIARVGLLVNSIIVAHLIVFFVPLQKLDVPPLYTFVALSYPVLYMTGLVYGVICLWGADKEPSRGLLLASAGFALHAVVDTFYAYDLLGQAYRVGDHLDVLWLISFALIYWGAAVQQGSAQAVHENKSLRILGHEVIITTLSIFFVLLAAFIYQSQLTPETIEALLPFALLMVLFIALGDLANQRYQSEIKNALERSQRHLDSVLETIPYGVQEIDAEGYLTYVNAAHDRLFGYPRGALDGVHVSRFFADPQDGNRVMEYMKYLLDEQPEPTPYFATNLKRDGTPFEIQIDWNYKRNGNGEVVGFISILTDVTEKRRRDEQLRQAAALFDSTSEGVIVTDAEGNITAVNAAFTAITGYDEAEVLGKNPRILRSERHDAEYFNQMWTTLKQSGRWCGEVWDRRKDGEVFPVWQAISAIKNDAGEVSHYVSVFSDISPLKQTQEKLNYLAYHDPLTDLPNRLLFNDRLAHALERALRAGEKVALLFIDLDNFKNVNDSLGHPAGDELLVKVATRLRALARKDDTVARLGGDEFVIILENLHHSQDTAVLARKLLDAFNEPLLLQGHELHVTLSIGIGVYPRDGEDVQTLVRNADAALYRAKEEGRNNFYHYTEELTTSVVQRMRLESALRNALKNDELVLFYQPQVALDTGAVIGIEALLRWRHPQQGLLLPSRFLALAEETGLIVSIGAWVLSTACRQMKEWQNQGHDFGRIAVNVSGLQLQRDGFQALVNDVLLQSGLEPRYLELEITENYIMRKTEKAIATLDSLKALDIQIAIDDFGTGYSSLSYLKRLPVDKLKIDRSFIRDIPEDADDEAIASAVVALARTLRLKVVAEGVESREQHDFLLALGCDGAQGFLYSQAVSSHDMAAYVSRPAGIGA